MDFQNVFQRMEMKLIFNLREESICILLLFLHNKQIIMHKEDKHCKDPALLVNQQNHDKFLCSICLQFMTNPYVANCQTFAKHVFGIKCIESWIDKKNGNKKCPSCRNNFQTLQFQASLADEASKFEAKCPQCETILSATQIKSHISTCQTFLLKKKQQLAQVVYVQLSWIQKQINPHLKAAHGEIYSTYVQDWKWLYHDPKNWKWWWWCSNPWWENKSCPICNELWHKYEKEIDEQENKRIHFLEEMGIRLQEEKEKVECEAQ